MKMLLIFSLFFSLALFAAEEAKTDSNPLAKYTGNKSLSFSGVTYLHYTYDKDTSKDLHTNSFNLNRIYLTTKGNITDKLSFNVTTDIQASVAEGDKYAKLYVKYGYASYAISPKMALAFGVIPATMNWTYGFWGYRYTGLMGAHEMGLATTADAGIQFSFTPNKMVSVFVGVTNGESYTTPIDPNENKDIYLTVIATPMKMLKVGAHVQYELPLQDNDAYEYAADAEADVKKASGNKFDLFGQLFVGFEMKMFKVGAELLFKQNEANQIETTDIPVEKITGMGFAGYLAVRVKQYGIHGKFIRFDPNTDSDVEDDIVYSAIGGFDVVLCPNLSIALSWVGKWGEKAISDAFVDKGYAADDMNHMFQISTQVKF